MNGYDEDELFQNLKQTRLELYAPRAESEALSLPELAEVVGPFLFCNGDYKVSCQPTGLLLSVHNVGSQLLTISKVLLNEGSDILVGGNQVIEPGKTAEILTKLPVLSQPNTIQLISDSISNLFSRFDMTTDTTLPDAWIFPEYFVLGALACLKLSIFEPAATKPVSFFLYGHFGTCMPSHFWLEQIDAVRLRLRLLVGGAEYHFNMSTRAPGLVAGELQDKVPDPELTAFSLIWSEIPFVWTGTGSFLATIQCDQHWVNLPEKIETTGQEGILSLNVNLQGLVPGRHRANFTIKQQSEEGRFPITRVFPGWFWVDVLNDLGQFWLPSTGVMAERKIVLFNGPPLRSISLSGPLDSQIDLFGDETFTFPWSESVRSVYLTGDFCNWQHRAFRLERKGDLFQTTLALEDGPIQYQFEVDGEIRLDPNSELVLTESRGWAGHRRLERWQRRFSLVCSGSENSQVMVTSTAPWCVVETGEREISGEPGEIVVRLTPREMEPGMNQCYLKVTSATGGAVVFPIRVLATVSGPVPALEQHSYRVSEGVDGARVSLEVNVVGAGSLQGELCAGGMIERAAGILSFECEDPYKVHKEKLQFTLRRNKTRAREVASLRIPNCYLANRRTIPLTFCFERSDLVCQPAGLFLPKLHLHGEKQNLSFCIYSAKGNQISPTVVLPQGSWPDKLLTVTESGRSKTQVDYILSVNPAYLDQPTVVRTKLRIKDEEAGAVDIDILAKVLATRAEVTHGESVLVHDRGHRGNSLKICNTGDHPLVIYSIRFQEGFFYCNNLSAIGRPVAPGEQLNLYLSFHPPKRWAGSRLRDHIRIRMNAENLPAGEWEGWVQADFPNRLVLLLKSAKEMIDRPIQKSSGSEESPP